MRKLRFGYDDTLSTRLAHNILSEARSWPNKLLHQRLKDRFDEMVGGMTPTSIHQVYMQLVWDLLPYRLAVKGRAH